MDFYKNSLISGSCLLSSYPTQTSELRGCGEVLPHENEMGSGRDQVFNAPTQLCVPPATIVICWARCACQ